MPAPVLEFVMNKRGNYFQGVVFLRPGMIALSPNKVTVTFISLI